MGWESPRRQTDELGAGKCESGSDEDGADVLESVFKLAAGRIGMNVGVEEHRDKPSRP